MSVSYEELRQRLEKERERLSAELEHLRASAPPPGEIGEGSPFGKREEEATEAFELEKRLALEKNLIDLLHEVKYALSKFDKGTYGLCESCGKPINPARLEILPQATLCLSCKSRQAKNARGRFTS
jgi:RNA polymerase-binding transcription factor DksA